MLGGAARIWGGAAPALDWIVRELVPKQGSAHCEVQFMKAISLPWRNLACIESYPTNEWENALSCLLRGNSVSHNVGDDFIDWYLGHAAST
jgi:hypothetical protein